MDRKTITQNLQTLGMIDTQGVQTASNCFEIAVWIAQKFGYAHPASRAEFSKWFLREKGRILWGGSPRPDSDACFFIYEPEALGPVHVVFVYKGDEYNFGAGEQDGFEITARLPLPKARE